MAEKETNSTKKTTTAKPAEKPASKATAKPAEKATPKATAKPAERAAPKTTAKPAEKAASKATAKPSEKVAPKTTAKPVEKPAPAEPKAVASKPAKSSGGGSAFKAKAAAVVRTDNFKIGAIIALACMFVLFLSLGLVLGLRNCLGDNTDPTFLNAYATTTKVGYSAEVEGTIKRYRPVNDVTDERDAFPIDGTTPAKRYPTYGSTPSGYTGDTNVGVRNAVINESAYLCAWGTAGANRGGEQTLDKYTKIDKDGWLYQYKNNEWIHSLKWGTTEQVESNYRQLYKHTASVGLYGQNGTGDVSDSEPGLIKKILLRPRGYSSYSVTGLYAPAGEVIKIELSGKDMDATGGITVHIGQALYNGQANNIWAGKNTMPRMAHVLTTLVINKNTATYDEASDTWTGYIGSFLGGPIYIRNNSAIFTAKISGAVAYRHFVLGYTTPEEYASLSKSTAPYFDLEVWDRGVLHSGPVRYAKNFSYDDLYKAAVLWEKVSSVTASSSNQGIVFIYDPFVAAGAAVAFPGRSSVNCPLGWMAQSLNYNSIVTSGSWGNFHEYHHNFQNYGLGSGADGEVTNNGLNLVSYSLFTKISSARRISGYGGSGLSGWNQYTSASWVIQRVNNNAITSTNGLAIYATLLHNFGQDQYTKARGASGKNNYLNKWATNTHYDMTYFASKIADYGGGNYTPSQAVKDANYPMFVPVASVYQTGRSYNYDGEKRYIQTMQPYVIPSGQPFTVDLNKYTVNDAGQYQSGSVVIGNGFKCSVKSVDASKAQGTFVKTGDGVYTFTPNSETLSGKIYVTLEITTENGEHTYNGHALEDVDLVLEFQQSHEANKNVLERTIYTFSENKYTSATAAYEAGYAGNSGEETVDNKNYSQNSNTDIWLYPERYKDDATFGQYVFTPNSVMEIKGKLYFPEAGKYRIYMRGRLDCALYISQDGGKTYTEAIHIARDSGLGTAAQFYPNDARTYVDVDVEAEDWIYFKEVLIVEPMPNSQNMVSFVGLGIGQWTVPMYTTETKYYISGTQTQVYLDTSYDGTLYYYTVNNKKYYVETDGTRFSLNEDGERVSESRVGAIEARTTYKDANGQVVSADKASNVTPVAPTSATYATAYRQSYEFQKQFESEYFYTRNYSYDYKDNVWQNPTQTLVKDQCKYMSPPTNWGWGSFPIENLVDGNKNTFIHTRAAVSESSPLELVVDMGEVKTVNRMIIYSQYRPNGDWKVAKSFTLKGSIDGVEFFDVGEFVDVPRNGSTVTVDFEKTQFRYYKLTVTKSYNNHIIIGEIEMWKVYELNGGKQLTPDNAMFTYTGTWKTDAASSSYGHVYVGQSGSEMKFEFEGAYLVVFSSDKFEKNYEVYIDGTKVDTTEFITQAGGYSISYLSPELSQGKHSVVIKCTGEANIDSVVFFNKPAA